MAGGIGIPVGTFASLGSIAVAAAITGDTSNLQSLVPQFGPYRPAQWSKPALTMITVPAAYTHMATNTGVPDGVAASADNGAPTIAGTGTAIHDSQPQFYVFDAVFNLGHSQPVTITKNPVQTGSNIADHAYLNPARLTLSIGMTNLMAAYAADMWTGATSKSVSAFQTLDTLRAQRIPLTVTTRLKTYTNMLIADVRADETVKTLHGLAATIELEQIYTASVATEAVSARPQTTDDTNQGAVQATAPSAGTVAQNQLPSDYVHVDDPATIEAKYGSVQGAGNWSSNNTSDLAGVYP